jgi:hypothetical protein
VIQIGVAVRELLYLEHFQHQFIRSENEHDENESSEGQVSRPGVFKTTTFGLGEGGAHCKGDSRSSISVCAGNATQDSTIHDIVRAFSFKSGESLRRRKMSSDLFDAFHGRAYAEDGLTKSSGINTFAGEDSGVG